MTVVDRRRAVGLRGEDRAADWYRDHGYEVVARNWRCPLGEIDLICRQGTTVVIAEVKARTSAAFGSPAEAVTAAKQRRLRRLAERWLAGASIRYDEVRFDVVAVLGDQLEVLEAAF